MPATTSPPGASIGSSMADSTRQSASRSCEGRSRTSATRFVESTAATASTERASVTARDTTPSARETTSSPSIGVENGLEQDRVVGERNAGEDPRARLQDVVAPDGHALAEDDAALDVRSRPHTGAGADDA